MVLELITSLKSISVLGRLLKQLRKTKGSKPILKKQTARIHPLDYKIDLDTKVLRVAVLDNQWIELRLR